MAPSSSISPWFSSYGTFWIQQDLTTYFLRFLMAPNIEGREEFVLSCDICSKSKNPRHCLYRLLQPLAILCRPWSFLSVDFITNLLPPNSFDSIFIVVDQLTKMAHFTHCKKKLSSKDTTRLFLDNMYWYHGLQNDIMMDWKNQFVWKFSRSVFEILKVDIKLSSTFYCQTNGQTEQVNQVLEQYLQCNINYQQDDWIAYLSLS